jgi:hypothetical protein
MVSLSSATAIARFCAYAAREMLINIEKKPLFFNAPRSVP